MNEPRPPAGDSPGAVGAVPEGRRVEPDTPFVPFPRAALEGSIPARFEAIVRRFPDGIALKTRREAWTYDALNRAANRVAHGLLARAGGGPEPIALLLDKDALLMAAILGVLKAGKIYVPLDPGFPLARLRDMVEDSQAGHLITNKGNAALARQAAGPHRPVLELEDQDTDRSTENLDRSVPSDATAYILYTSGSTGEPKGVFQSHRNVLHAVLTHTNRLRLCADDRVSLLYSCSVNGAIRCIFGALLNGATLLPFDLHAGGVPRLASWLMEEEITLYQSVPTVFRALVGTLQGGEKFPRLRLLYLGGEPVYAADVELYRRHLAVDCLLVNGWGPTEITVGTLHILDKATPLATQTVPIGFPVDDAEILLLDETRGDGRDRGEIAVRSPYLALGYWGRPDLTRETFLPDPSGDGRRVYRTGDLGRRLPDGSLELLGRKDFQVKVRGVRVEPGEIEATLAALPAVREAIVVAREDRPGDQRLVAYVVPAGGRGPTPPELRQALARTLPDHMLPAAFVLMDALPMTPTGKVDRRALPPPAGRGPDPARDFLAPRTVIEEEIAAIWAEVLGLERIGIHDHFLDLGGHSLLATQIFTRITTALGVDLPIKAVLDSGTVAEMALVVAGELARHDEAGAATADGTEADGVVASVTTTASADGPGTDPAQDSRP